MTNKARIIDRIENAKCEIKEYKDSVKFIEKHYNALMEYNNNNAGRLNVGAIELEVMEEIARCNERIATIKTDIRKMKRQIALIEELENIEYGVV